MDTKIGSIRRKGKWTWQLEQGKGSKLGEDVPRERERERERESGYVDLNNNFNLPRARMTFWIA